MVNAVITLGLSVAGLLVLSLLGAALARGRVRWVWIAAAAGAAMVHDVAVTRAFGLIPKLAGLDADWNVSGKVYSIAALMILIGLLRIPRREIGLSLGMARGSGLGWLVCLALVAILAAVVFLMPGEGASPGTLAYQATLPGLAEELFYRGLLFALVARAFAPAGERAAVWIPAIIVTLAFALAHVLVAAEGVVRIHPTGAPTPLIIGAILIWLRVRTGGLAAPVLLHNSVNTALRLL